MPALFGRALDLPVLRPLAERVAGVVAPLAGSLVVDAPADGGMLAAAIRSASPASRVVALVAGAAAARETAAATSRSGVRVVASGAAAPALRGGLASAVASLLTLGHEADPRASLAALAGILEPGGATVVAAWAGADEVPHLAALDAALWELRGTPSPFVRAALSLGDPDRLASLVAGSGLEVTAITRLRDVVRFDGVDHLLACHAALPLRDDLAAAGAGALARARDGLATRLLPVTAWDGTLVVPVALLVLVARRR